MSWGITVTGTREAVLKHVKAIEPTQYQMKLVQDLIVDELTRPQEEWLAANNGVRVVAGGHSGPQGAGWEKSTVHKSGNLNLSIEIITVTQ